MDTPENSSVLVIIPAYNEQANIRKTVENVKEHGFDYVVINDGSRDNTQAVLDQMGARSIRLVRNLGIGGAVQTGYLYAQRNGYKAAVQFDGDGQHDASYIAQLVAPIFSDSADIVVGSRYVGNESDFKSTALRRMGIKMLSFVLKLSTGVTVYDVTSGFRAMGPKGIELFASYYPVDYPEPESLAYASAHGLSITEIPVAMHERQGGSSSISGLKSLWYMVKVGLSICLRGTRGK